MRSLGRDDDLRGWNKKQAAVLGGPPPDNGRFSNADALEPRVDPNRYLIKEVFHRIRILPRKLFASRAGRSSVTRAFDYQEVLVGTCCHVEKHFAVANEIVSARRSQKSGTLQNDIGIQKDQANFVASWPQT